MSDSPSPVNARTDSGSTVCGLGPGGSPADEDLHLGWECAHPSLQIEAWLDEARAQPLQAVY